MREWEVKVHSIGKWRMKELRAICRQYPQMQRGTPAQRDRARKIELCAKQAQRGAWKDALLANCCTGVKYEQLDECKVPTSNRNAFFAARREFFSRLDDVMK